MTKDVIQTATWQLGAEIAREMKLSPQGWSSKVRSQPMTTIKKTLLILKKLGRRREAEMIIQNFLSFVRVEFGDVRRKPLTAPELVSQLQLVIFAEVEKSSRTQLLEYWQNLQVTASFRICEISCALDGEEIQNLRLAS